jgi:hypothetical protein
VCPGNDVWKKTVTNIVDDEHGVYFQDVDTEETVWELPKDGDVVVKDNELQSQPNEKIKDVSADDVCILLL